MAKGTRNTFLSEKRKEIKDMDEFYEYGTESVMKYKVVEDKKRGIVTTVKLEYIYKGGLYHPSWNEKKGAGYGYEVLTTGYVLTFSTEDTENGTMFEKVDYFDDDHMLEAFERVVKYCQMAEA